MAINKNALIRYKALDKCFRNTGRKYFIEDLIISCEEILLELDSNSNGISRRQILEDIKFMESDSGWSIQLERQRMGKRIFYRYADINFSINNMPLNELEINQLESAMNILSQFKGMPQFEWVNELIPKLKQGITQQTQPHTIIDFDNNQYLKGIEKLGELYNAIFYKKVLSINYQPFENEKSFLVTIHPYYLKQYNNRWFLYGYNPENKKYDWNLALDRIIALKEVKGIYQINKEINWQDYFDDIVGVTKPENAAVENMTLHFYGKTGNYMETKPIHGSQKSKWINSNTLEVNLQLIINYEFERLILSYANSVKVIKPLALKKMIKERMESGVENYQ